MTVLFLSIAGQGQAASEESDVPQVGAHHTGPGVHTEDLDAGEGSDHTNPEAEHVGDAGDGDGDDRLSVALADPHRYRVMDGCFPPGCQHDESVVDSNPQHEERSRQVDSDEIHSKIHDEAKC